MVFYNQKIVFHVTSSKLKALIKKNTAHTLLAKSTLKTK